MIGLTATGACSKAVEPKPVPSPAVTASAAIYLTADGGDAADGNGGGVVVSVGADGAIVGQVKTKGIEGALLARRGDALYFSDSNSEYRQAAVLSELGRPPEEHAQSALYALANDISVSVMNHGIDPDTEKYVMNVAVTSNDKAVVHPLEGFFTITANCDGKVVGIREPDVTDQTNLDLVALGPDTSIGKVLGHVTSTVPSIPLGMSVPCVDGNVMFLFEGDTSAGAPAAAPRLVKWDIATGKQTFVPLKDVTGQPFHDLVSRGNLAQTAGNASAYIGGHFYWATFGGDVMATDAASGITKVLWTVPLLSPSGGLAKIKFGAESVTVFDAPDFEQTARLTEYSLTNGKQLKQIMLPAVTALSKQKFWAASDFSLAGPTGQVRVSSHMQQGGSGDLAPSVVDGETREAGDRGGGRARTGRIGLHLGLRPAPPRRR